MTRKRNRLRGMSSSHSLADSYKLGVYHALRFVGKNLATATITALTFAFVYKYIVAKQEPAPPGNEGA